MRCNAETYVRRLDLAIAFFSGLILILGWAFISH
jgi:hypothetical protein